MTTRPYPIAGGNLRLSFGDVCCEGLRSTGGSVSVVVRVFWRLNMAMALFELLLSSVVSDLGGWPWGLQLVEEVADGLT